MPEQTPWEQWKADFIKEWADYAQDPSCTDADIARDPGWDAWKFYYDKGLSPSEAIEADATGKYD